MRGVARKKLRPWHKLGLVAAVVIAGGLLFVEYVDWPSVREWMQHLDRGLLLVLSAILPLFGLSIGLVYLVIGAAFGGPMGVLVVAGITAVHLLGSHWIGHSFLRSPLERWLKRRKRNIPTVPPGEEWSVALMTALVPGLPYLVRNYLLAVSDIPLRIYFWVCWPVYVARSCLVIFLGDFSSKRLVILGVIFALKIGICAYILQRLRKRLNRIKEKDAWHRKPAEKPLAHTGRLN